MNPRKAKANDAIDLKVMVRALWLSYRREGQAWNLKKIIY
jgi:hypothetical protein